MTGPELVDGITEAEAIARQELADNPRKLAELVAGLVVAELRGPVISAEWPEYVTRELAAGFPSQYHFQGPPIYWGAGYDIRPEWQLHPGGRVVLRVRDWRGQWFWTGEFGPPAR